jgi:hypothetical protein
LREAFYVSLGGPALVVITSPDMLLTRAQAAEVAGVTVERIRTWERRGHLEREGVDANGLPLYAALNVAKCKHKFHGYARDEAA